MALIAANNSRKFASYGVQLDSAKELRVLSQLRSKFSIEYYHNYVYPSVGPGGATESTESFIYHAEFGINEDHPDLKDRGNIDWLCTPRNDRIHTVSESDVNSHSTCMASKATGRIFGATKEGKLVVVAMVILTISEISDCIRTILSDIMLHNRQRRSVVTYRGVLNYQSGESVPLIQIACLPNGVGCMTH